MDSTVVVTSRGPHHQAFAVGRVHVLVLARQPLVADEVDSFYGARRSIEELYPDGHVAIADFRSMERIFDRETRAVIASHVRAQRTGHLRARAVILPSNPDLARVVRGFMVAYFQAPGVRCPDAFVWNAEDAYAFVTRYVRERSYLEPMLYAMDEAHTSIDAPVPPVM